MVRDFQPQMYCRNDVPSYFVLTSACTHRLFKYDAHAPPPVRPVTSHRRTVFSAGASRRVRRRRQHTSPARSRVSTRSSFLGGDHAGHESRRQTARARKRVRMPSPAYADRSPHYADRFLGGRGLPTRSNISCYSRWQRLFAVQSATCTRWALLRPSLPRRAPPGVRLVHSKRRVESEAVSRPRARPAVESRSAPSEP